jgi:predicted PurR-regulated permease PerM
LERPKDPILSSSLVARAARVGIVAWATVGIAVLVFLFGRFILYPIRIIFPPLILALVIVYLLNPVVTFLERRGVRRGWATFLTYLTILSAVGIGLAYLIPVVTHQAVEFGKGIPQFLANAQHDISNFARKLGFTVNGRDLFSGFGPKGQISSFIGRITSIGVGVLHAALTIVLGIVIGFYLLMDLPKIRQGIRSTIPARRQAEVEQVGQKLSTAIGGYFRGQLLVAAFVGVASMFGLWLVGLPYWAPVGLVAGLFNLVPLIGPFIGAIPAVFIAFTTPQAGGGPIHLQPGWELAVGASLVLLVVQQLDNHIVSPNIVSRTVKLHPLTVMLSLLAAGTLLGLVGMLLVIPVVASAKILVMHYWDTRMMWPPPGLEEEGRRAPASDQAAAAPPEEAPTARDRTPPQPVSVPPAPRGDAGAGRRSAGRRMARRGGRDVGGAAPKANGSRRDGGPKKGPGGIIARLRLPFGRRRQREPAEEA